MSSTAQEYWDACLIKAWRSNLTIGDVHLMFTSILGRSVYELETPIKRKPRIGFPYKVNTRVFVASYLPKISERLWGQAADRDVALLNKLSVSNYDTLVTGEVDASLRQARKSTKKNLEAIVLESRNYGKRNQNTDWNVVKGSVKTMRSR